MSSPDLNKPSGKSGKRAKKAEQRRKKSDVAQSPDPVQALAADVVELREPEPIEPQRAEPVQPPVEHVEVKEPIAARAASPEISPADEPVAAEPAPVNLADATAPAESLPVNLQTIAKAYGDYTRKSLEETRCFFEQLTGVRSPDKAVKLQTEFAKQAYETFMVQSQKIYDLHSQLAKQTLKPWQGFASKASRD